MRMRDTALGLVVLAALGCKYEPTVETGPKVVPGTLPTQMGGLVEAGTQRGRYPLGPATTEEGQVQVPTGLLGVSLDGTVPARLVNTPPPPEGAVPTGPRARMGGEVAFVPGVPDRLGHGLTGRNGAGTTTWGAAMVPSMDFTDVETVPGAGPAAGAGGGGPAGAGPAGKGVGPSAGQTPSGSRGR